MKANKKPLCPKQLKQNASFICVLVISWQDYPWLFLYCLTDKWTTGYLDSIFYHPLVIYSARGRLIATDRPEPQRANKRLWGRLYLKDQESLLWHVQLIFTDNPIHSGMLLTPARACTYIYTDKAIFIQISLTPSEKANYHFSEKKVKEMILVQELIS